MIHDVQPSALNKNYNNNTNQNRETTRHAGSCGDDALG
jgi:hypothetical protein